MSERPAYRLHCCGCDAEYEDDGLRLGCEHEHEPSLLRTRYTAPHFADESRVAGSVARYVPWLPVVRDLPDAPRSVAYHAAELGRSIGLENLWVGFTGLWPRRGAWTPTGTFKDLEASTVLGRLPESAPVLVVSSAGNTAAAFGHACSAQKVPCVIIVPKAALHSLDSATGYSECVTLVAIDGDATYDDAIRLAGEVGRIPGFQLEGGVRNVGRRDGLATCLLTLYDAAGRLPDHYVQGVGSGAGVLATHEAAMRIIAFDDAYPSPRLLLCQNAPYSPLYDLWYGETAGTGGRDDGPAAAATPQDNIAPELTNGTPPFAVRGGVRDALAASGGRIATVSNDAARQAMDRFERIEGVDIEPAAGVALAGLTEAVAARRIAPDAMVMLNITGGGRAGRFRTAPPKAARPDLWLTVADIRQPAALEVAAKTVAEAALR